MSTRRLRHSAKDARAAVDAFEAIRAERAAVDAKEILALAAARALVENAHGPVAGSSTADVAYRALIADLAAAVRVSERTVRQWVDDASDVVDRFGDVVVALGAGRISRAHLAVIYEHGAGIVDDDARDAFTARMLALAEEMTPARLRQLARIAADRARPRTIDDRHRDARVRRRIRVFDLPDGMSELTMVLPSVLAHAIYDRATKHARTITRHRTSDTPDDAADTRAGGHADAEADPGADADTDVEVVPDDHADADPGADTDITADTTADTAAEPAGDGPAGEDAPLLPDDTAGRADVRSTDERSMDELRADVVTDLLLTGTASTCTTGNGIDAIRATVQITVPVLRATGTTDDPALLTGTGPIDIDTALRLAGTATGWERVMTSPLDGAVLTVDRYTPDARLHRFLRARDEHCRFPGCRMPVWRCDIDHTTDHAHGGPTSAGNLAHLCRHHHTLKHASPWTVRQHPHGLLEWTSPTGRVYTDTPEPTLRFTPTPPPDEPPPPF